MAYLSAGTVVAKYKYIPTKTEVATKQAQLFPKAVAGISIMPVVIGVGVLGLGFFLFKFLKKKKVVTA